MFQLRLKALAILPFQNYGSLNMPDAPASIVEKSLQINVTSVADARACIRHLQKIRDSFIAYGCTSIELCVYSGLENEMQVKDLSQNFRWCKTFRKIVAPFEGNVLFSIPHFDESAVEKISELEKRLSEASVFRTVAEPISDQEATGNVPLIPKRRGRPKSIPLADPVSSDV